MYKGSLALLLLFSIFFELSAQTHFYVKTQEVVGVNHKFWQAAGHDFLFNMCDEPAGKDLMSRIKEYGSVRYLRTHATFSNDAKKGGQVVKFNADGSYPYDFNKVNNIYKSYLAYGIKPIVEFDFFPDKFAKSLGSDVNTEGFKGKTAEPRSWEEWENLLNAFMTNLETTFGKEELKTWYFEVWNEPDGWPVEHLDVFFRLYDTFAYVVKSHNKNYKVGGPGTFNIFALKTFLDHVVDGTNYITKTKGSPIDFISHHIYGLSGGWLALPPSITPQVSRFSQEILWIQRLLSSYKGLDNVEFHLNEWGVCSNFNREVKDFPQLEYRNNEFSPLFMVKLVDCLYTIETNYKLKTSLMLYWGFAGEDAKDVLFIGNRELTTGGNTPKPILTGFEFLSKLASNRVKVIGNTPGERLGIIPTSDNEKTAILLYNFNETDDDLDRSDKILLTVEGLKANQAYQIEEFLMDRKENNSYSKWKAIGSPAKPAELPVDWKSQLSKLESSVRSSKTSANGVLSLDNSLQRHSMKLIMITTK